MSAPSSTPIAPSASSTSPTSPTRNAQGLPPGQPPARPPQGGRHRRPRLRHQRGQALPHRPHPRPRQHRSRTRSSSARCASRPARSTTPARSRTPRTASRARPRRQRHDYPDRRRPRYPRPPHRGPGNPDRLLPRRRGHHVQRRRPGQHQLRATELRHHQLAPLVRRDLQPPRLHRRRAVLPHPPRARHRADPRPHHLRRPCLLDQPYSFRSDIYYSTREREHWDETRAAPHPTRPPLHQPVLRPHRANGEDVDIHAIDDPFHPRPEIVAAKGHHTLTSFGLAARYDTTDSRIFPTRAIPPTPPRTFAGPSAANTTITSSPSASTTTRPSGKTSSSARPFSPTAPTPDTSPATPRSSNASTAAAWAASAGSATAASVPAPARRRPHRRRLQPHRLRRAQFPHRR